MPPSKLESLFIIPPEDGKKTFEDDEKLPSLPLPELRHTLCRYLDSVKPFVTSDEYAKSLAVVKSFEEGIGQILHGKLKEKANREKNWIEKWWEQFAYLQVRLPLIPYCSMDGVMPKNIACWSYGTEDDQIKHASYFTHYLVQYWCVLRKEKLLPTKTADKKTVFSMSQFKRLFNTVRIPGENMDSLVSYFKTAAEGFCPATVVVMCRGRMFCVNAIDASGNPKTPPVWEKILSRILRKCNEEQKCTSAPGILTCDKRSSWSKNRKHLENLSPRNKEIMELIDRCLFVLVLDDATPESDSDVSSSNLCGDYNNRWCDKSMSMIFYKNGRSGALCDHTAYDGIISIACHHYVLTALEESKDDWLSNLSESNHQEFEELKFDLDETLECEIKRLRNETTVCKSEVSMSRQTFEDYGKIEMQRLKFHPDSYVQMCLQAAYFNLHKKPAACYETATTRKFYNGRTETVRCCTTQCLEWVYSMFNVDCSNEDRKLLFERAIKRQNQLMNEARENAGCDRHLFGMYCIALEEGIQIPELYLDPSYLKSGGGGNFVLSTSCTGYTPLGGGVAPMCKNGYGIFYNILPNKISFTISVNKKSDETDAEKFFQSLKSILKQTRQMLLWAGRNLSKF